jgi:hypothetical protein
MLRQILDVQLSVAEEAGVELNCVVAASSLIGRTSMPSEELEAYARATLDEDEQEALIARMGLARDGPAAAAPEREGAGALIHRAAAVRDAHGAEAESAALIGEMAAAILQEPSGDDVGALMEAACSLAMALAPGVGRTNAAMALAWTAVQVPVAWSDPALDMLRALLSSTAGWVLHPEQLRVAVARRAAYNFALVAEAFDRGSLSEVHLVDLLRSCLADALEDVELLEPLNALIDLVATRAGDRLPEVVDLPSALHAWEAAHRDGATARISDAALLVVRAWTLAGLPPDENGRVGPALQVVVDDVLSMTTDSRRIYILTTVAALGALGDALGLTEPEACELELNISERAVATVARVGWEVVTNVLVHLCSHPQGVTAGSRRLGGLIRQVCRALVENGLEDLWLRLTVWYCLSFRNIHSTDVSTAEERADLLTDCVRTGRLDRCPDLTRVLAMFCICETLSALGLWRAAMDAYGRLQEELRETADLPSETVAVLEANRLRTACVVAAITGDAVRAAHELQRIRTEARQPPYPPDHVDALSSDLTTTSIVLMQAPSDSSVATALEVVEDCLGLSRDDLASLPGHAYVAFVRIASDLATRGALEVGRIEELLRASAGHAQQEASSGDPRLAQTIREVDLRLASLSGNARAVAEGFRAILAHQDIVRLGSRSYRELMATSAVAGALLGGIDILADQGKLRVAAELLDELPCRTVRLAAAVDMAAHIEADSAAARLAQVAGGLDDPALDPSVRSPNEEAGDDRILWEELTWATLLGAGRGEAVDEAGGRIVLRLWSSGHTRLRLLVTTPDGSLTQVVTDRNVGALPPPDEWDARLLDAWAGAPSSASTGADMVPGTFAAQMRDAMGRRDAHCPTVAILDFTGEDLRRAHGARAARGRHGALRGHYGAERAPRWSPRRRARPNGRGHPHRRLVGDSCGAVARSCLRPHSDRPRR